MEPKNQIFMSFSGPGLKGVAKRSQGSILGSFLMYFGDISEAILEHFWLMLDTFGELDTYDFYFGSCSGVFLVNVCYMFGTCLLELWLFL